MKPRNEMLLTIAAATLVATGFAATANADAKGTPNPKSVATVTACTEDSTTVRVCASKDLSNVVLQCGESAVKFDDLEVGNVWSFTCPDGLNVTAVWVKAGSGKTAGGPVPGNGTGTELEATMWPVACADPVPTEQDPCAQTQAAPQDL